MAGYRRNLGDGLIALFKSRRLNRGAAWGLMIIGALLAFELFNFSTTQFALRDIVGDLAFAGMRWATILAVAFCGIDFAGIARIFTPRAGPRRARRGMVPVRRLAAGGRVQRHANLVGHLGGDRRSHQPRGEHGRQQCHHDQGRAGVRLRHGAPDPRPDHWDVLVGRRPAVHDQRAAALPQQCAPINPHRNAIGATAGLQSQPARQLNVLPSDAQAGPAILLRPLGGTHLSQYIL